jgi:hypothetical protein
MGRPGRLDQPSVRRLGFHGKPVDPARVLGIVVIAKPVPAAEADQEAAGHPDH